MYSYIFFLIIDDIRQTFPNNYFIILLTYKNERCCVFLPIYLTLSVFVYLISLMKPNTILNNKFNSRIIILSLIAVFTVFLTLKIDSFLNSDTLIYVNEFKSFSGVSLTNIFKYSDREPLYVILVWLISQVTDSHYYFIAIIWLISCILLLVGLKKVFRSSHLLYVFFTYIHFPLFMSYILIGTRQGLAMTTLTLALCSLLFSDKKKLFYLLLLVAPLFHSSAWAFSIILLLIKMFKTSLKFAVTTWCLLAIFFVTSLNNDVFGFLRKFVPDIDIYTSYEAISRFQGVNRLDFLLFSAAFLVLGIFLYNKIVDERHKHIYKVILNCYILFNLVFLMLGFIAFSNRISTYSWYLIPLLVWYPVIYSKTKNNPLKYFMILIAFLLYGYIGGTYKYIF
jgi:hypothetical protein